MELKTLRMKKLYWRVVLPVLGLMLILFTIGYINNHRQLNELNHEEADLKRELSQLHSDENHLRIKLDQVDNSSTLDAAARAEDFIKPGELRFSIDNSEGQLEKYTEVEWDIMMQQRELGQY